MSGGSLCDYNQFQITQIVESIKDLIKKNGSDELTDWGEPRFFSFKKETIDTFKATAAILEVGATLATRIDWLVSGDDSEESFHEQIKEEFADYGDCADLLFLLKEVLKN